MATKTHMVTCRLDDRDYGSLHENAAALDVAPSTYMRYLIRIPVSACPDPRGSRVLVIDAKTLGALRYELVRWGRHYNQGVHALNASVRSAQESPRTALLRPADRRRERKARCGRRRPAQA